MALLLGLIALCGCARHYIITLNNGAQIVTSGKPHLKEDKWYYKDPSGKKAVVASGRVREVAPASMVQEEQKRLRAMPGK